MLLRWAPTDEKDSELRVVHSGDGRRHYDEMGKRALVDAALNTVISVALMAQQYRVNANTKSANITVRSDVPAGESSWRRNLPFV